MKNICALFLFLLLISCSGEQNQQVRQERIENDSVQIIQEAYHHAVVKEYLTDVKRTRNDQNQCRVYSEDKNITAVLNHIKGDSMLLLKEEDLCKLNLKENFVLIKDLKIRADSAEIRLISKCVYKDADTCIIGGWMCGGGIGFTLKQQNNGWVISNALGVSF